MDEKLIEDTAEELLRVGCPLEVADFVRLQMRSAAVGAMNWPAAAASLEKSAAKYREAKNADVVARLLAALLSDLAGAIRYGAEVADMGRREGKA